MTTQTTNYNALCVDIFLDEARVDLNFHYGHLAQSGGTFELITITDRVELLTQIRNWANRQLHKHVIRVWGVDGELIRDLKRVRGAIKKAGVQSHVELLLSSLGMKLA